MATKQDFEACAGILRDEIRVQLKIGSRECANVIALVAKRFANDFARQNGRFDRARFYHACGLNVRGELEVSDDGTV